MQISALCSIFIRRSGSILCKAKGIADTPRICHSMHRQYIFGMKNSYPAVLKPNQPNQVKRTSHYRAHVTTRALEVKIGELL